MLKTVVIAVILLFAALILMAVKVLFVRGGRFPSGHVHDIPALRSRGDIGCAASQGRRASAGRVDDKIRNKSSLNKT